MSGVSICICGAMEVCDRTCAGALAQQQECAERGHLTPEAIYMRTHGRPRAPMPGDGYCYRCGESTGDES